jgi:4-amino-4-deoxy-L-arabinose transferase-like glycosyltransferase
MRKVNWNTFALATFITAASLFYWLGLPNVPFHPDESTQLFMSADFKRFFSNPLSLVWDPNHEDNPLQHYREMDAPLTRDILGFAGWIRGFEPLKTDWNWTLSWQENKVLGALPEDRLLLAGRVAVGLLYPLTLILIYSCGKILGGSGAAWTALILTAGNALILLHTRRAMAESSLVFTTTLSLWAILRFQRYPWLTALPVALAFNSKQSALVLILPALVSMAWQPDFPYRFLKQALLFLGIFAGITWVLNPFLWNQPLQAMAAAWHARAEFTQGQVDLLSSLSQNQAVLRTLPDRIVGTLAQLFFTPPAIADVGNYLAETRTAADLYLANPLHQLLRGLLGGAFLFSLSLFGWILALRQGMFKKTVHRRPLILLVCAALSMFVALVLLVPVPFQRYYMILVPVANLLAAYGFWQLVRSIQIPFLKRHPIV